MHEIPSESHRLLRRGEAAEHVRARWGYHAVR